MQDMAWHGNMHVGKSRGPSTLKRVQEGAQRPLSPPLSLVALLLCFATNQPPHAPVFSQYGPHVLVALLDDLAHLISVPVCTRVCVRGRGV